MSFRDTEPRTNRRQFVGALGSVGGVSLVSGCLGIGSDGGGEYPSEPIRAIIPYGEGGGADTYTRNVLPVVADILGTEATFENVPGAGGLRGTGQTYRADPDGYTLTFFSIPQLPLAYVVQEPDWELLDMMPTGIFGETVRQTMFAHPDFEIESLEDLFGRYQDGDLDTIGSGDQGGVETAIALLMRSSSEYNFPWENIVEYEGSGPMIQAVASKEVPVGIGTDASAAGSGVEDVVDVIATLSSSPSAFFPDAPSLADAGYPTFDFLSTFAFSFYFPPETPEDRRDTVAGAVDEALSSDEVQQWSEESGFPVGPYYSPDDTKSRLEEFLNEVPQRVDLEQLREARE